MQQLSDSGAIDLDSIEIPADTCCNCGSKDGLSIVPTPLKKTRFMLLGGTELTLMLGFPYCSGCAVSASKHAIGTLGKLLIAFMIFWVLIFGVIFLPFDLASFLPGVMLPLAMFSVAIAITLGYFRLRRPTPPRTSVDQPVMLRGVKQMFSGDIVGLRLGFSNEAYKREFEAMNQMQMLSGALSTESVG